MYLCMYLCIYIIVVIVLVAAAVIKPTVAGYFSPGVYCELLQHAAGRSRTGGVHLAQGGGALHDHHRRLGRHSAR